MATTKARITLTSADIMDSPLSISNESTLFTAGTNTGIVETTGLARKKFATASNVILLDHGLAAGVAADVRGDGSKFINILLAAVEIGRLYGGDWMFIPWSGGSGKDIEFTPSDATETTLEYMVFYE